MNLEQEFINWYRNQTKFNGEPYSENTINTQRYCLKTNSKELLDLNLPQPNLFLQTNLQDFIQLCEKIRKSIFFPKIDEKNRNGAFSTGLRKYRQFLEERETKQTNENPTISTEQNLEQEFVEWFKLQPSPRGEKYSPVAISSYTRALKNACEELTDITLPYHNLFWYTNAQNFERLQEKIRRSKDFDAVNKKYSNQAFSAGLVKYQQFLQERETQPTSEKTTPPPPNPTKPPYTAENFLSEIYISREKYTDITSLLNRKKNIILQGAPGVGKSFIAKRLAFSVIGTKDDSKLEMVQFHQSYSYEDFIEGFRPTENGNFSLKHGVFRQFCDKAKLDPANPYFFIIDEINRGNLSKIMGELMFLLEHDKRGEEFAMPLTYSAKKSEKFFVPKNVHIIGMMNTADRSLAMLDYALRRRFSFITIEPAFDNPKFIRHFSENFPRAADIIQKMQKLNKIIADELDSGHKIGHSYFCSDKPLNERDVANILKYEIAELLQEYFFDNPDKLAETLEMLEIL
ncbi:MAG: AAA family ATPase [Defluviitaleaceae bacterium]|nr:AAA family ATPase [Defluviitaleaceae bacterium]